MTFCFSASYTFSAFCKSSSSLSSNALCTEPFGNAIGGVEGNVFSKVWQAFITLRTSGGSLWRFCFSGLHIKHCLCTISSGALYATNLANNTTTSRQRTRLSNFFKDWIVFFLHNIDRSLNMPQFATHLMQEKV